MVMTSGALPVPSIRFINALRAAPGPPVWKKTLVPSGENDGENMVPTVQSSGTRATAWIGAAAGEADPISVASAVDAVGADGEAGGSATGGSLVIRNQPRTNDAATAASAPVTAE